MVKHGVIRPAQSHLRLKVRPRHLPATQLNLHRQGHRSRQPLSYRQRPDQQHPPNRRRRQLHLPSPLRQHRRQRQYCQAQVARHLDKHPKEWTLSAKDGSNLLGPNTTQS